MWGTLSVLFILLFTQAVALLTSSKVPCWTVYKWLKRWSGFIPCRMPFKIWNPKSWKGQACMKALRGDIWQQNGVVDQGGRRDQANRVHFWKTEPAIHSWSTTKIQIVVDHNGTTNHCCDRRFRRRNYGVGALTYV